MCCLFIYELCFVFYEMWHPDFVKYSDNLCAYSRGEIGVLQLVSEQVGPSGQVVESSRIVMVEYCP